MKSVKRIVLRYVFLMLLLDLGAVGFVAGVSTRGLKWLAWASVAYLIAFGVYVIRKETKFDVLIHLRHSH